MAEETQELEPTQEEEQPTDWQAKYEAMRQHSRDWEKKAKENLEAAEELARLKEQQMSEQEKANARAEKAESELAEIKAKAERLEKAQEVAEKTGVPLNLLQFCPTDEMETFAESYMKEQEQAHHHAAPKAKASNIVKESSPKTSEKREFVRELTQAAKS